MHIPPASHQEPTSTPKELFGMLGITVLLYWFSNFSNPFLIDFLQVEKPNATVHFFNRLLLWMGLLLLFLYSRHILKQNLLLWREKKHAIGFTLFSILIVMAILFIGLVVIAVLLNYFNFNAASPKTSAHHEILKNNIPLFLFSAFTAGFLEEVVLRGFIQPRIERIVNSQWLGIFISSLLFGLMHLSYGTIHQVLIPAFFGIVLATHYAKYRSITIVIICHFLWDLLSGLDSFYNS